MTTCNAHPDIILYGGPASGKGAQAKLLAKKLLARHMNMGGLLRKAVETKHQKARLIKKIMEEGKLVPETISAGLMREFVAKVPSKQRIVFDGYPRTTQQAKNLIAAETKADRSAIMVFIDLPTKVAKQRIVSRAKIEGRADDMKASTVNERIKVFKTKSKDLLNSYRLKKSLILVNGDQTVMAVHRDILKAIKNL
jgi:adenylate kinase